MAFLIQVECDGCRFVPDSIAVPHHRGKPNLGNIRDRVKAMGWVCKKKDGGWRFYCEQCAAERQREPVGKV